jgi:hypothetical protein
MALIFSEEFEGTLGAAPPGWDITGVSTATTGGYHNQCLGFNGNATALHTFTSQTSLSLFFVSSNGALETQCLQKISPGVYTPLVTMTYANDGSILITNGAGASTSADVIVDAVGHENWRGQERAWTFVQTDFTFTNTTIGTASAIKVVVALRLNGEQIGVGTGTFLSNLTASVDTLKFIGDANSNNKLDSVYIYNPILSTPIITPNPGTPNARVSQALFEYLRLQSDSDARVSQAVIEVSRLPSDNSARVSQAVIELIRTVGVGWRTYEA